MKQRIQAFMRGRYGSDSFSRFLVSLSLIIFIISFLTDMILIYWLGVGLIAYSWFRLLSRNTARRTQENIVFYQIKQSVTGKFSPFFAQGKKKIAQKKSQFSQRKTYRFFHCPQCRQTLRVPRGKGKIEVTCPKCHTSFLGKT